MDILPMKIVSVLLCFLASNLWDHCNKFLVGRLQQISYAMWPAVWPVKLSKLEIKRPFSMLIQSYACILKTICMYIFFCVAYCICANWLWLIFFAEIHISFCPFGQFYTLTSSLLGAKKVPLHFLVTNKKDFESFIKLSQTTLGMCTLV